MLVSKKNLFNLFRMNSKVLGISDFKWSYLSKTVKFDLTDHDYSIDIVGTHNVSGSRNCARNVRREPMKKQIYLESTKY
ncbi:hypothetical protein BpHYR1_018014 [Brachionus plicatilis]|uniref:Uncharacterized protein n=1 Tax=Brachionus plicatilis TaxID=10195 RepID=A0A3M7P3G9_BRAPC|nr:hypothetical protein BpHYR1_018014 [Brachionus plicatilis]